MARQIIIELWNGTKIKLEPKGDLKMEVQFPSPMYQLLRPLAEITIIDEIDLTPPVTPEKPAPTPTATNTPDETDTALRRNSRLQAIATHAIGVLVGLIIGLLLAGFIYRDHIHPETFLQHVHMEQWLATRYSATLHAVSDKQVEVDNANIRAGALETDKLWLQQQLDAEQTANMKLIDALTIAAAGTGNTYNTYNNLPGYQQQYDPTSGQLTYNGPNNDSLRILGDMLDSLNLNGNGANSQNSAAAINNSIWLGSYDSGAWNYAGIGEIRVLSTPANGAPGYFTYELPVASDSQAVHYLNPNALRDAQTNQPVTVPGRYKVVNRSLYTGAATDGEATQLDNVSQLWLEYIGQ